MSRLNSSLICVLSGRISHSCRTLSRVIPPPHTPDHAYANQRQVRYDVHGQIIPRGLHLGIITILIVDDNAYIRRGLCELFKREPDVEGGGEAHDGQDAIDQAQRLHPDLVIMDLSMPVLNGLDASRALKKLLPSVPIILFTLNVYPFLEVEAQAASIAALGSYRQPVVF